MPVLAIVTHADDAAAIVRWSASLAAAREAGLTVLYVGRGTQDQAPAEVALDQEDDHPVLRVAREAVRAARARPEPPPPAPGATPSGRLPAGGGAPAPAAEAPSGPTRAKLERVSHRDPAAACLARIDALGADLVVIGIGPAHEQEGFDGHLAAHLARRAACDVLLLRSSGAEPAGEVEGRSRRVVIPTAGGPHARVALRLGAGLARIGERVEAVFVEPEIGEDAAAVGRRRLDAALAEAGVRPSERFVPRVVLADRPAAGILAAAEGADLLVLGATNEGVVERTLFGSIPEQVLRRRAGAAVAVLRGRRPVVRRTWEAVARRLRELVPQLERDDRIALFDRLQTGSSWNVDFMALIGLSATIAALGLLQNSTAVVIGAMLVAPLMTPMIGAGLALVQGNQLLAREAGKAIVRGFLLALGLSVGFGLVVPVDGLSPEILARGAPTLIDLGVAFFSGVAAAYALARPNLSGAMAGVAIAAALVPPVASIGISLAHAELENARGAALLFATNLVAIILGSAALFWAMGVKASKESAEGRLWVRRVVLALVLAVVALSIPLTALLLAQLARPRADRLRLTPELVRELEVAIGEPDGYVLVSAVTVARDDGSLALRLLAGGRGEATPARAAALAEVARRVVGAGVPVEVVLLPSSWATSGAGGG